MEPARSRHLRSILEAALKRAPAERSSFLQQACGGDEALRREVESQIYAFELGGGTISLAELAPVDSADNPPTHIGSYRIAAKLGQGPMGEVYTAHLDDVRPSAPGDGPRGDSDQGEGAPAEGASQPVAIKVLAADVANAAVVSRSRRERMRLTYLQHPNIARLIDSGTTVEGRLYLVMEHVEGVPLDRYCEEEALDLEARLDLFRRICVAVHAAHQNLVVHRNLKPSNILITADGSPKLLDLGIAALLEPASRPLCGAETFPVALTPDYASPELLRSGAVTTASDIFTLGVLLYELLTGRRPFATSLQQPFDYAWTVGEVDPTRPSIAVARFRPELGATGTEAERTRRRRGRRLAGDLDAIVLCALNKEPAARYGSALELARDLERFQAGRPVEARQGGWPYRLGKLVHRHGIKFAAASLVFLLGAATLVGFARDRARLLAERENAVQAARFWASTFAIPEPGRGRGNKVRARAVLDNTVRRIDYELDNDPALRADLLATVGQSYKNLGLYPEAESLLRTALGLHRRTQGEDGVSVAADLHQLAEVRVLRQDYAEGEILVRKALALLYGRDDEDQEALVRCLDHLAHVRHLRGDPEEAQSLLEQALGLARQDGSPALLSSILDRQAAVLAAQERFGEAEVKASEAMRLQEELWGSIHPAMARSKSHLAALRDAQGDYAAAETLYRQAESVLRQLHRDAHPDLAATLDRLALVIKKRGRFIEAETILAEAEAMRRAFDGAVLMPPTTVADPTAALAHEVTPAAPPLPSVRGASADAGYQPATPSQLQSTNATPK